MKEEEEQSCKRRKSIAGEKIKKRPKQRSEESTKYSMISMLQQDLKTFQIKTFHMIVCTANKPVYTRPFRSKP